MISEDDNYCDDDDNENNNKRITQVLFFQSFFREIIPKFHPKQKIIVLTSIHFYILFYNSRDKCGRWVYVLGWLCCGHYLTETCTLNLWFLEIQNTTVRKYSLMSSTYSGFVATNWSSSDSKMYNESLITDKSGIHTQICAIKPKPKKIYKVQ